MGNINQRRWFCFAFGLLAVLCVSGWAGPAHALNLLATPQANDRIAIIAPHPDDEVLATSGLIQQAVAVGAQVKVIYLTNGDHNQSNFRLYSRHHHITPIPSMLGLGEQRHNEALAAMQLLGLTADDLTFLGYPDWWTMRLWQDYWEEDEVLYDNATDSRNVPYQKNYSYQHPYRAEYVIEDLCKVLREFKPTWVFTTHPCDANSDHRAAANFVQLALLQLESEGLQPTLDFYIVHYPNWPVPLQYHPTVIMEPPPALQRDNDWLALPLTREQVERKYQATMTNATQVVNQQAFLTAFARANELFAMGRIPTIPLLPAQAELDWSKAIHLQAPAVLPTQSGYETNGVAVLPTAPPAIDLEAIDFLQQDDALIAQVELKCQSNQHGNVRWYLFGYKQGTEFADLPKVQITILPDRRVQVVVDHEAVEDSGVTLTGGEPQMILRVPLKLLGGADIDHLFTAALAYLGATVTDDTAWHLLRFESTPKD